MKLWHPPFSQGIKAFKSAAAFTLVELSIVIVIIGLIIGGVTAGKSLIKTAQLHSVLNDVNKYTAAVNAFKLQYSYYPGDLPNAASYWAGCGSGSSASDCNGNGNSVVDVWTGSVTDVEDLRAWQHLNLAGLVPGSFTGVSTAGTEHTSLNVPTSSYQKGLWGLFHYDYNGWTVPSPLLNRRLNLQIGLSTVGGWQWEPYVPLFSPADAYGIDKKVDDGMPQAGNVFAINGGGNFTGSGKAAQYGNLGLASPAHVLSFGVGR